MTRSLNSPYWWINSRGWYRGTHEFAVVVTNDLDVDAIRNKYKAPDQVERCDDLELFVYEGQGRSRLQYQMQKRIDRFLSPP